MRVPDLSPTKQSATTFSEDCRLSTAHKIVQSAMHYNPMEYNASMRNKSVQEIIDDNWNPAQNKVLDISNVVEGRSLCNDLNQNLSLHLDSIKIAALGAQSKNGIQNTNISQKEKIDESQNGSFESTKELFIPRGIINPNYPGFQKYAHTLADHYIEYSSSEYYESDISDYDMESENAVSHCNNYSPETTIVQSIEIEMKKEVDDFFDNGNSIKVENITSELLDEKSELVDKTLNASMTISQPHYIISSTVAPDILIKNCKPQLELNVANPNHPDLLNNVGIAIKIKDDQLLGHSPVDIIGDFGKEVEREFDLLVPGYKKLKNDDSFDSSMPTLITDAGLSSASENLKLQISQFIENSNEKPHCIKTNTNFGCDLEKPKYQKSSHDDRQLPPVVIDYKQSQSSQRVTKKTKSENNTSVLQINDDGKCYLTKKNTPTIIKRKAKVGKIDERMLENAEITQYQDIVSNKEQIIRNSRYSKTSDWAKYLGDSVNHSLELTSPSALEQFDAYKVAQDIDMESLQNHFKMAKEIEKKRRSNREEIRKRLAMEAEPTQIEFSNNFIKASIIQDKYYDTEVTDEVLSDTESHSSDSETCPKLSKGVHQSCSTVFTQSEPKNESSSLYHWNGFQISNSEFNESTIGLNERAPDVERCDFFTKQSKLQIEARMALAQSKEVAHMKMKIEKQKQAISPITEVIRSLLDNVGINMDTNKRWMSRQLLTGINISQLQYLVDNLHTYIENFNANLVGYLVERDDLQFSQDAILHDIEQISRYIVSKEHDANEHFTYNNRS